MAGTGETYARSDGKFAFRLKAGNGEIVATDGNQGYEARASAKSTLTISVAQGGHIALGSVRATASQTIGVPHLIELLRAVPADAPPSATARRSSTTPMTMTRLEIKHLVEQGARLSDAGGVAAARCRLGCTNGSGTRPL